MKSQGRRLSRSGTESSLKYCDRSNSKKQARELHGREAMQANERGNPGDRQTKKKNLEIDTMKSLILAQDER